MCWIRWQCCWKTSPKGTGAWTGSVWMASQVYRSTCQFGLVIWSGCWFHIFTRNPFSKWGSYHTICINITLLTPSTFIWSWQNHNYGSNAIDTKNPQNLLRGFSPRMTCFHRPPCPEKWSFWGEKACNYHSESISTDKTRVEFHHVAKNIYTHFIKSRKLPEGIDSKSQQAKFPGNVVQILASFTKGSFRQNLTKLHPRTKHPWSLVVKWLSCRLRSNSVTFTGSPSHGSQEGIAGYNSWTLAMDILSLFCRLCKKRHISCRVPIH